MNDYSNLSREKLIEHCKAYSDGMHDLGTSCQKLTLQVSRLRDKLRQHKIPDPTEEMLAAVPVICEGLFSGVNE
jgi:hypothetical protein